MISEEEQKTKMKDSLYNLGFEKGKVDSLFIFHFPLQYWGSDISIDNWKIADDLFVELRFQETVAIDRFHLIKIRALLHQRQEIEHTVINGIDTALLEQQMQALDWTCDYRDMERRAFLNEPTDMTLLSLYLSAIHNLVMLNADEPRGVAVSNELKLRHFLATPYEDRFVSEELKKGKSQAREFYLDDEQGLSIQQIRNVLEGRAVLWDLGDEMEGGKQWLKLIIDEEHSTNGKMVGVIFKKQERHPDYDLAAVLSGLPIIYSDTYSPAQLLQDLQNGDLKEIQMLRHGKAANYTIAAAPVRESVNVYDDQGKRFIESISMQYPKAIKKHFESKKKGSRPKRN